MPEEILVTAEGLAKMETELRHLTTTRRAEIAEEIKVAREFGDISENAEYASAKDAQGLLEARILQLEEKIRSAVIVAPVTGKSAAVQVGNTVTVTAEENNNSRTYTIVGAGEAAPDQGKISYDTPIGRALMGLAVGETAVVRAPRGERRFTINKIA